jgi:hypothetical protein
MTDTEINARRLATVDSAAKEFTAAGQTTAAIRCAIWRAADRRDPRGKLIPGNGLAATGAIIRHGRRVLIDLDRYAAWLAGAA